MLPTESCALQGRCEAMELVIVDLRQQLAAKTASSDRWQQECKAAQQQLARELDQRQHFQGEAAALRQQLASVSLHASTACPCCQAAWHVYDAAVLQGRAAALKRHLA